MPQRTQQLEEQTAPKLQTSIVLERARQDPDWWCQNVLGSCLWPVQKQIIESVRDNPETAVASCHGAGKSFIAAQVGLWFLYTHYPAIVITTAPTDRQVRGILWKEIRLAHQRAKYPLGGKLLTQELKLEDNWWAWGFTAPDYDPDRFQGFHEENILVIVDEACGVSEQIYEGIDGVLSSQNARLLMIGNPTDPSGRFGKSFKLPGIKKFKISAFDTPNFTAFGITEYDIETGAWQKKITGPLPFPSLVAPHWVARVYRRWGKDSPLYLSRVKGEFPEGSVDNLIPLAWIEAAQRRELEPGQLVELGVDVARFGDDETVIALRCGPVVTIHSVTSKENTMQTAGRIVAVLEQTGATLAKIDEVGVGAGVVDRLVEQGKPVWGLNVGREPRDKKHFANARAEWYWELRARFEAGTISIPADDEELAAQLSNIKFKYDSQGRIQIESKDDMKKRGLPSPDRADAVMLALAGGDLHDDTGVLAGGFPGAGMRSVDFDTETGLDEDDDEDGSGKMAFYSR